MLLLSIFFVLTATCKSFNDSLFEAQPVFAKNMNITVSVVKNDVTTRYVPMGRHIILNCMSWNSMVSSYDSGNKTMKWIFHGIQDYRSIPIDIKNSRFSVNKTDGSAILYTAQKENEDVQDCDGESDLTSYRNVMNPCLYGACLIDAFPSASILKYLRCNCILQYTGEFCTELVDGAIGREVLRFSPFIAHVCSTLCIIVTFFCCRRTGSNKRIISLEDLAPPPPSDTSDDPRILYPAAMLPAVESVEPIRETELDARTIAICLDQLQHATIV
ncbi:unnamed protein product [Litomosoides sigmodontis]|uniref:EGF-like domain-containing protein n=1 Tax=Litomosoides sigmodontis TaxID=42156 RepID=A0A3P6TFV8_LITSI|nr:unnamed protein product [Litomosoides sigmodontis]